MKPGATGARLLIASAFLCATAWAADAPGAQPAGQPPPQAQAQSQTQTQARPKLALVLSGGGARGVAHVGVLKALQELRVPVDIVVGTSMGAVVGGAYASGRSVEELERFASATDWKLILADRPPRDSLPQRRRADDVLLPSRVEFGIGLKGPSAPQAAAGSGALDAALGRLLGGSRGDKRTSEQPLPFSTVATHLLTGQAVALDDVPLRDALRASLAVPGVFKPLRVRGEPLVDGGLVNNVPVNLARGLGAQQLIVVNVGTPLAGEEALESAFSVAQQMLNILTEQNVQRSLAQLGPNDILITPNLGTVGMLDFERYSEALRAGYEAAMAVAPRLRGLSTDVESYARHEAGRSGQPRGSDNVLPLATVQVVGNERSDAQTLAALSGLQPGAATSLAAVEAAAARIYNRGDFARVEPSVEDRDGQRRVTLEVQEAPWAASRLRIGLELESDFSDNSGFSVSALHVLSWLNPWGAELRSLARIGTRRSIGTEWWQPLGRASTWFARAGLQYDSGGQDVFIAGLRSARIGTASLEGTLALGRQLGDWGAVEAGLRRSRNSLELRLPQDPTAPTQRLTQTQSYVQFSVDTLDSLAIPSRGLLIDAQWSSSREAGGGEEALSRAYLVTMVPFRLGQWAGHAYTEWSRAEAGRAPLSLGGFFRLSGTPADSVSGNVAVLGRLALARRVGSMPAGLGGDIFIGASLETGGASGRLSDLSANEFKRAMALYVSVDTRFGPLYWGVGHTFGGRGAMYLFLGPVWR